MEEALSFVGNERKALEICRLTGAAASSSVRVQAVEARLDCFATLPRFQTNGQAENWAESEQLLNERTLGSCMSPWSLLHIAVPCPSLA